MECSYLFNGKVYNSYKNLIEALDSSEIDQALSILYSLKPEEVANTILRANRQFNLKIRNKSVAAMDGEPDIDSGRYLSLQQFIDSPSFTIDGKAPIFQMDFNRFLDYKKKDLMMNHDMTEDEAEEHVKGMKEHWDIIAKDAFDMHKILVSAPDDYLQPSLDSIIKNSEGTAFQNIPNSLENASIKILQQIFKEKDLSKLASLESKRLLRNINLLSSDVKGLKEPLAGHFDYILIHENGDVEVFNIKSSTERYINWDHNKKEKYRCQLALLKRMLESNGVSTKNIQMNIIPVKMNYDSTWAQIEDVEVEEVVNMEYKGTQYIFKRYDQIAEHFIPAKVKVSEIPMEAEMKITKDLQMLLPESNLDVAGVKETAKSWLDANWNRLQKTPLSDGGWEIQIPGDDAPIQVKDPNSASRNKELVTLIEDRLEQLSRNEQNEKGIYWTIKRIKEAYENNSEPNLTGEYGVYLQERISKYLEVDDEGKYVWELKQNNIFTKAGMLVFVHSKTKQIDTVTLTNADVGLEHDFKGRKHLLGNYIGELNTENFTLSSNYGNIETIRTLAILNQVLPNFEGDFKLGELQVLGISRQFHGKKGVAYNYAQIIPEFNTMVRVVNHNNPNKPPIVNNFIEKNIHTTEPSDVLIQNYYAIIGSDGNEKLGTLKDLSPYLITSGSVEAKVEKLNILIEKLRTMGIPLGINFGDSKKLLETARSGNKDLRTAVAMLYIEARTTRARYLGDFSLENERFGAIQEYGLKNNSISNSAVRTVGFMFQRAADKIANDVVARYSPNREVFMEFYEKAGYTNARNEIIGDQAKVFKPLYETDEQGNRLMRFKNPYDLSNGLKDYEREFLKKILFEFHKLRCDVIGETNTITGIDDPILSSSDMPKKYLNVPLERASNATRRTNSKSGFKEWTKRVSRMIKKPNLFFEELQGLVGEAEQQQREEDIRNLQAYNPFRNSEMNDNVRQVYIDEKGVDYFEYNIENLLIDYTEKHIQSVELTQLLSRVKGIELDLILRGETEQDEKALQHTMKVINDYLMINVFNKSIMGADTQKLEAFLAPIRSSVSKLYVAGNIAGSFRDIFQGLLENISNAVIKYQTDIGVKDVGFGYKEVLTEGATSLMTMTKLNQFNLKYRLSNLDIARISEGQKTGRGGILNWEHWAYSTLRAPDYMNRMVLFIARMHKDGCYDAYEMKNGRLEYDWTKDKRFELLQQPEPSDPELKKKYNEQLALKYSLIRQFNIENGTQLNPSDPLPDAYTLQEIYTFKNFADTIYGSYNQSTRTKAEQIFIGRNFLMFSTWMNGIVDAYCRKTQISESEIEFKQEVDYNTGKPLYFTKDGSITTEPTELKVMKGVPIMVQGIAATIGNVVNTLHKFGYDEDGNWSASRGWQAVQEQVLIPDGIARRNMRRLFRDLAIAGILTMLFKMLFNEMYRDHKANADGEAILANAITEVMYKSTRSCFDTFMGPAALLDYIGNQTNPAAYKMPERMINNVWSWAMGNKTFGQMVVNTQALPRTFQDTYNMWLRDTGQLESPVEEV